MQINLVWELKARAKILTVIKSSNFVLQRINAEGLQPKRIVNDIGYIAHVSLVLS